MADDEFGFPKNREGSGEGMVSSLSLDLQEALNRIREVDENRMLLVDDERDARLVPFYQVACAVKHDPSLVGLIAMAADLPEGLSAKRLCIALMWKWFAPQDKREKNIVYGLGYPILAALLLNVAPESFLGWLKETGKSRCVKIVRLHTIEERRRTWVTPAGPSTLEADRYSGEIGTLGTESKPHEVAKPPSKTSAPNKLPEPKLIIKVVTGLATAQQSYELTREWANRICVYLPQDKDRHVLDALYFIADLVSGKTWDQVREEIREKVRGEIREEIERSLLSIDEVAHGTAPIGADTDDEDELP